MVWSFSAGLISWQEENTLWLLSSLSYLWPASLCVVHALGDEVSSDGVDLHSKGYNLQLPCSLPHLILRCYSRALYYPRHRVARDILSLHLRVGPHLLHDVSWVHSETVWLMQYRHFTVLVGKLDRSVDPPAFLGDVKLDLQLLLNEVITENQV